MSTPALLLFSALGCSTSSDPIAPPRWPTAPADTGLEQVPGDTGPAWTPCADPSPAWINEAVSANLHGISDDAGDEPDWVELALADPAGDPVDLGGWALGTTSDAGWPLPDGTLLTGDTLLIFASGDATLANHADFTLDPDGEDLFLLQPTAEGTCVADHVELPRLYNDVSYGRSGPDPAALEYFVEPTPGAPNTTESRPGFSDPPTLSPAGGFYADPVSVTVTGAGTLTYTLDGSVPTSVSTPWTAPVDIDATSQPVVVRARQS